jgi:hypothetical protein
MTFKDLQKEARKYQDRASNAIAKNELPTVINDFFLKAYEYEKQAYILYSATSAEEPTRSSILLNAADLALKAELYREAEKMASIGLAGEPSDEDAEALRNLSQAIHFHKHISYHGIVINPNELILSLSGNQVGKDTVRGNELLDRIDTVSKLAFRVADRLRHKPFNEKGKPSKAEHVEFESYLTIPQSSVFAVNIGFGVNNKGTFPSLDSQPFLIEDLLSNLALVNLDNMTQLYKSIPDEAYRNNFIALTKKLSPDGDRIKTVGLSAKIHDKPYAIKLSKPKSSYNFDFMNKSKIEEDTTEREVEIIGTLFFADSKKSKIKLFDEYSGKEYLVEVPKGILSDVVRPYFEEEVKIKGLLKNKVIHLNAIDKLV